MSELREAFESWFRIEYGKSYENINVALEMRGDFYIESEVDLLWDCWKAAQQAAGPSDVINSIIRDISELANRTSPNYWPDAMLVTADELTQILKAHLFDATEVPDA